MQLGAWNRKKSDPILEERRLSGGEMEAFREKLTEGGLEMPRFRKPRGVLWQKYDPFTESYSPWTPMNSYDVLKCSQAPLKDVKCIEMLALKACFHLFEYLRLLLPPEALEFHAFRMV